MARSLIRGRTVWPELLEDDAFALLVVRLFIFDESGGSSDETRSPQHADISDVIVSTVSLLSEVPIKGRRAPITE